MEGPIAQVWYLHYPLAGPATVFLNNWTVRPRGVKIEDPLTPKPSSMLILDFKMKYGEFSTVKHSTIAFNNNITIGKQFFLKSVQEQNVSYHQSQVGRGPWPWLHPILSAQF